MGEQQRSLEQNKKSKNEAMKSSKIPEMWKKLMLKKKSIPTRIENQETVNERQFSYQDESVGSILSFLGTLIILFSHPLFISFHKVSL